MSITEVFGGMSIYRHSSITTTLLQHLALFSLSKCTILECFGNWKLIVIFFFRSEEFRTGKTQLSHTLCGELNKIVSIKYLIFVFTDHDTNRQNKNRQITDRS